MPIIKVSPVSFFILAFFCYSMRTEFMLSFITAVACHEIGHLTGALFCGCHINGIAFSPLGFVIERKSRLMPLYAEILLYAAGPAVNLFIFFASLVFGAYQMCFVNICLFVINILPVRILDGGKILYAAAILVSPAKADTVLRAVSTFFVFIIWLFSVYLLIISSSGLSMFFLSLYLFASEFIIPAK